MKEYTQQLAEIYNNLLRLEVRGENVLVLADSMRELYRVINQMAKEPEKEKDKKEE